MESAARRILPLALLVLGAGVIAAGLGLSSRPAELSIEPGGTGPPATISVPSEATPASPSPNTTPSTSTSVDELADIGRRSAASLPDGITPVRVEVPSIGVDAPLITLGQKSEDEIEVPGTAHEAGWYTPSRRPGEIGPAIVAGHVDLNGGPAVFHRLRELRPGDEVNVMGDKGESLTFVVERLGQYPKTGLPDDVFGFGGARPELRLITCGGVFNRATGHYEDNIVVYAYQEQ